MLLVRNKKIRRFSSIVNFSKNLFSSFPLSIRGSGINLFSIMVLFNIEKRDFPQKESSSL